MVLCSKPVGLRHFTRVRPKTNERRWYAIMWGIVPRRRGAAPAATR